jgi:hypothetical protein
MMVGDLHLVVGLGCTRQQTRDKTTIGGWSISTDVPGQNPIFLSARPLRAGTFHLALILTRNGDFFEKQMDRRRDGNGD